MFRGELISTQQAPDIPAGPEAMLPGGYVFVFEPERVYKGEVVNPQWISSSGSGCGTTLGDGDEGTYLVFARRVSEKDRHFQGPNAPSFEVSQCDGTRLIAKNQRVVFGAGRAVDPAASSGAGALSNIPFTSNPTRTRQQHQKATATVGSAVLSAMAGGSVVAVTGRAHPQQTTRSTNVNPQEHD